MRLQDSQANCGPTALRNGLAALGIDRSTQELETACGTSATDGTSTRGIIKGASKIEGVNPVVIRERKRDVALLRLRFALDEGRPVMLVWNSNSPGDHWVVAIGRLGYRILIADSADNELVLSLDVSEVADRWVDGQTYEGVML